MLSGTVNAPWFVPKSNFKKDSKISYIKNDISAMLNKYHETPEDHSNPLITSISSIRIIRTLKKCFQTPSEKET